jgi:hypothetical protein
VAVKYKLVFSYIIQGIETDITLPGIQANINAQQMVIRDLLDLNQAYFLSISMFSLSTDCLLVRY